MSPPGFSVMGILQARILEWVAYPPPEDLPKPEIEPRSSTLKVDSLLSEPSISNYWGFSGYLVLISNFTVVK